jgi:hypothetical protein
VYSLDLLPSGADTTVKLFIDNEDEATETWSDVFVVDGAGYEGYIAAARTTDASTFGAYWNGYVYDFHVYQAAHDKTTNTSHAATCTGTNCSTLDFG